MKTLLLLGLLTGFLTTEAHARSIILRCSDTSPEWINLVCDDDACESFDLLLSTTRLNQQKLGMGLLARIADTSQVERTARAQIQGESDLHWAMRILFAKDPAYRMRIRQAHVAKNLSHLIRTGGPLINLKEKDYDRLIEFGRSF